MPGKSKKGGGLTVKKGYKKSYGKKSMTKKKKQLCRVKTRHQEKNLKGITPK